MQQSQACCVISLEIPHQSSQRLWLQAAIFYAISSLASLIDMTVSLQGLQVECVGMPMHLVNKMGEPDSQDERFVDVFDGGMLLTRQASDLSCMPITLASPYSCPVGVLVCGVLLTYEALNPCSMTLISVLP